jgi:hypothetical protein
MVRLSVIGTPTDEWRVERSEILVPPDKAATTRLVLVRTTTDPQSGPKQVAVLARIADSKPWRSESIAVMIPAVPSCEVSPSVEPGRVKHGASTVRVNVHNTGNTYLSGKLECWQPPNADVNFLNPGLIDSSTQFDLAPGASEKVAVRITLPKPSARNQNWSLPLAIKLDGIDGSRLTPHLEVTQVGWLAQVPDLLRELREWGGARRGPYRRGFLVATAVAILVVGVIVGQLMAPSSPPARLAVAVEPSPRPLTAVATTTATATTSSLATPPYVSMPCVPGMSIVLLASLKTSEGAEYAPYLKQREENRLSRLHPLPKHSYHIMISDHPCGQFKFSHGYTVFVWTGPVLTSKASTVCTEIGKPQGDDCSILAMK